jgi:hypothetical protein
LTKLLKNHQFLRILQHLKLLWTTL